MVGAIIGGVAALGAAGVSAAGSSSAAGTAAGAASKSQQLQLAQMQSNIARTDPFVTQGQIAAQQLPGAVGVPMDLSGQPLVGNMPTPPAAFQWNPTLAGLQQTPGYQFSLQQGLQAQQNSATARGLGVSGAQLRGAADYAEGLAGTTYNQQLTNAINTWNTGITGYNAAVAGFGVGQGAYQNQFNDYWANQQNKFNQLKDISTLGANSAVYQSSNATTGASNVGNAVANVGALQGAGQAAAASTIGNALASPQVQNLVQAGYNYFGGGGSTIGSGTNLPGAANYNPLQTAGGYTAPDNQF